MNRTDPDTMTAEARLNEVASILAAAIRRMKEKQNLENISLDKSPNQWPHAKKPTKGEKA
ncbi:MAG: hypothetical protein H7839_14665 [Magnetococcus sp. YQC-5]